MAKRKRLDAKMKDIVKLYFFSLGEINDDISYQEDPIYSSYINRVCLAFKELECFEKLIINNDFFYIDRSSWWEEYCNQEYYIKRKKHAIKTFLRSMNYDG